MTASGQGSRRAPQMKGRVQMRTISAVAVAVGVFLLWTLTANNDDNSGMNAPTTPEAMVVESKAALDAVFKEADARASSMSLDHKKALATAKSDALAQLALQSADAKRELKAVVSALNKTHKMEAAAAHKKISALNKAARQTAEEKARTREAPAKAEKKVHEKEEVCGWRFLKYEPSNLESLWMSNILEWQSDICTYSDEQLYEINGGAGKRWMKFVNESNFKAEEAAKAAKAAALHAMRQGQGDVTTGRVYPTAATFTSDRDGVPGSIFSTMHYENTCDGSRKSTLIEPLAGMLRDPECCSVRDNALFLESSVLNKGYMLIDHDIPDRLSPQLPVHSPRPLPYSTALHLVKQREGLSPKKPKRRRVSGAVYQFQPLAAQDLPERCPVEYPQDTPVVPGLSLGVRIKLFDMLAAAFAANLQAGPPASEESQQSPKVLHPLSVSGEEEESINNWTWPPPLGSPPSLRTQSEGLALRTEGDAFAAATAPGLYKTGLLSTLTKIATATANKEVYSPPEDSATDTSFKRQPMYRRSNGNRALYFDMGASVYTYGLGGSSQAWFIDTYAERGVDFDELFMWEATSYPPEQVYEQLPADLKPRYHWYNVPVAVPVGDTDNALEYVRSVARPDDYVVMKIDIDMNSVERPLIDQIIASSDLHGLIDELFFEHHVQLLPGKAPFDYNKKRCDHLLQFWWNWQSDGGEKLADSYRLFRQMREKGILAHAWV